MVVDRSLSKRRLAVPFKGASEYCHICYSNILLWPRGPRSVFSTTTSNDFIRH